MSAHGRILAVDYGHKRTGLAVTDGAGIAAHPLPAIVSEDLDFTIDEILAIAADREVRKVVVGMPYLPSGLEGAQVQRVRLFLGELRKRLPQGVPIHTQDERHTTSEAQRMLRMGGLNKKKAKPLIDSTAAVVILRQFIESPSPGETPLE